MDAFQDGILLYQADQVSIDGGVPNLSEWDDGFIAFSDGEIRLDQAREVVPEHLFADRVAENKPFSGYVMEVDLWRQREGAFEELVLEREDSGLYRQYWKLRPSAEAGETNCYFRTAATRRRSPIERASVFATDDLRCLEVIHPENRLHFFIPIGRKTHAKTE